MDSGFRFFFVFSFYLNEFYFKLFRLTANLCNWILFAKMMQTIRRTKRKYGWNVHENALKININFDILNAESQNVRLLYLVQCASVFYLKPFFFFWYNSMNYLQFKKFWSFSFGFIFRQKYLISFHYYFIIWFQCHNLNFFTNIFLIDF